MERTIKVKGTAQAKRSPDQVVLGLFLETLDLSYEKAMKQAGQSVEELTKAISAAGFSEKALKTTTFDVNTHYRGENDAHGNYQQIFDGYQVTQGLRLEMDWDPARLNQALLAVSKSRGNPRLEIRFTLKDPREVQAELLRNAAANALEKARILSAAAQVQLGELLNIDYSWSDIHLYSETSYMMKDRVMLESAAAPPMEPEDIRLDDSATFVWSIH